MGLTMKWVYILASSAVCFSAPNPQKITDKNINKVQNVAIDQTRCAVNYVNALFEKGTHTKGLKFGQLIDVLGNQAMKNPQPENLSRDLNLLKMDSKIVCRKLRLACI